MTRENNKTSNKTTVWSYDELGNITAKTEYAYTTGTPSTATKTVTYGYGKDGKTGWNNLLVSVDKNGNETTDVNETITYDAIGNPLTYLGATLTWNGRQLTSYKTDDKEITYTYNSNGIRASKIQKDYTVAEDGTKTLTKTTETKYYYVNGQLHYQDALTTKSNGTIVATKLHFYYDSYGYLTSIKYNGTNYYVATNKRGDVVALYYYDGRIMGRYEYDAWGNVIKIEDISYDATTGNQVIADLTNNTTSRDLLVVNPIRYRSYYYDTETQLYYLQSRYYDPEIGRFINADGYVSTGQGVLSYNMFAYCMNNPVMYSDPSGCFLKKLGEKISAAWNNFTSWCSDTFSPNHDVPLYNQGNTNLCWAYSQTMVEDSLNGITRTQEEANTRARELGEARNGPNNWADPGWPANAGEPIIVDDFYDVALAVVDNPVYALYNDSTSVGHMVVVTGVSLKNQTIFVNNPWGVRGELTYDEFIQGFPGENENINDYTFTSLWDVAA